MDFKQLRYFLAVRDYGSINRASSELRVAQPAVSRQIRKLEEELGARLVDRSAAGIRLTKAGMVVCDISDEIFRHISDMKEQVGGSTEVGGRLAVGLPPAISKLLMSGSDPMLPTLQKRFKLNISEGPSYRLLEWVDSGELAVAIVTEPDGDPQFDRFPIWEEPLFLVGAATEAETVELTSLVTESLILTTREDPVRIYLDREFERHGIKPSIELEIESLSSLLSMIANSKAKSIMPLSAFLEEYDRGTLSASRISGLSIRRVAVTRKRFRPPQRVRQLVSFFQNDVAASYRAIAGRRGFDLQMRNGISPRAPEMSATAGDKAAPGGKSS